jgi:hypothetical protein
MDWRLVIMINAMRVAILCHQMICKAINTRLAFHVRHCYNSHTPEKLKGLSERQKQIILAKKRGVAHIGITIKK